VVVLGGQNGATNVPAFTDVSAYDPATDSWTKLDDNPAPRHGFAGGVYNNQIFVFMGAPQQGVSATVESNVLVPG
jgi:N-acetylneuraminic acid mutarotase